MTRRSELAVATPLALHGRLVSHSYEPSNDLSVAEWRNDVALLATIADRSPWWVGDALIAGEQKFGKVSYDLLGALPLERPTLRSYKWTASRIPPYLRTYAPSFSHGVAVASLPTLEKRQEWLTKATARSWTHRRLVHELREARRNRTIITEGGPREHERYRLFAGDLSTIPTLLEGERVDAIVTDVPYSREAIAISETLSEVGAAVLRPGGLMAVMTGILYLGPWLDGLTRHLNFVWVFAGVMPNHGLALPRVGWQQPYSQRWKPIIVLANGEHRRDDIWTDVVECPRPDKRFHPHEQHVQTMSAVIERVTGPGELVLDPCVGSGTTGLAALALGRRFIGVDIESAAIEISAARLAEAVAVEQHAAVA